MTLSIGTTAPDFVARDQNNKKVRLSGFRGRHVILYFYPKDFTPGCTKEARSFQKNIKAFQKHNVVVLGVGVGTVSSHKEFAKMYKLSFPLLADEDMKISKSYDVIGLLGKVLGMAKRVTYIIDKKGVIEEVFAEVKPEEHAKDLVEIFGARNA